MLEINRIYFGDCLGYLRQIEDNSIDLVVTDPPYVINKGYNNEHKRTNYFYAKQYHHEINDIRDGFSTEVLDELCRVMKRINIYLFCSKYQILPLLEYFCKERDCNFELLTMHKRNPLPINKQAYLPDTEYIMYFRDNGVKLTGVYDTMRKYYVINTNKEDKQQWGHPTIKPLQIVQNFIYNSSQEGDIVLDPFIGSGTTAVAARALKRDFIGFEINEDYYKTANERLEYSTRVCNIFDCDYEREHN